MKDNSKSKVYQCFQPQLWRVCLATWCLRMVPIPVGIISAKLLSRVVASATTGHFSSVLIFGVLLILITILIKLFEVIAGIAYDKATTQALQRCKLLLYRSFFSCPLSKLYKTQIGDTVEKLNDDFKTVTGKMLDLTPSVWIGFFTASIYFGYLGLKNVSNLSFSITCGQKVAIVGENGSGKTTLIKILSGLIMKKGGSLRVNNVDVERLSIESRRSHIAYAEQNPYLFKGTVRENIRLGNLSATDIEIDALANRLGIISLCERDVIGGEELSGGEKQKISIARALLKDTEVILLDEPSNHLDVETKNWLMQFIKNSAKGLFLVLCKS